MATGESMVVTEDDEEWYETTVSVVSATLQQNVWDMFKYYTVLRCNTEHYEHSSFFFSAVATEKNIVVTEGDGECYETVVSVVSATW